jgi:hypothetical protein
MGPLGGQLERFIIVQILTDRGVEIERVGRALAFLVEEQDAEGGERLVTGTDVEPRRPDVASRWVATFADPVSWRAGRHAVRLTIATEMPGTS